eukprot:PhF_6_TR44193/c0_g1_i1/m.67779
MDARSDDGASNAGSQTSGASGKSGKGVQLAGVLNSLSVFPLLQAMEWPTLSPAVSYIGLVVELLQLYGLVLNVRFSWSYVVENQINYILYFFHLPLWDKGWAGTDATYAAVAFFWINVCIGLGLLAYVGSWFLSGENQTQTSATLMTIIRSTAHALPAGLTFPIFHSLLAFMVCDSNNNMYWFEEYACWSSFHAVHFAAGIVFVVFFFVAMDVFTSTIFEDGLNSRHPMARADSAFSEFHLLYKFGLVCLYHTLLAFDMKKYFPIALLLASVLLSAVACFCLPYYNFTINKLRTGMYISVSYVALLATIEPTQSYDLWYTVNASTILLFLGTPIAFGVGFFLPYARVPKDFLGGLKKLQRGEVFLIQNYVYPNRLPENDLVFSEYKDLELELNPPAEHNAGHKDEEHEYSPDLLYPFVKSVWIPTDVELACRGLRMYSEVVENQATPRMCAFASRIHTKGLSRWPRMPIVVLNFVQFLYSYSTKSRAALTETERLQRLEASFAILYRNSRIQSKLKSMLGMFDNAHTKVVGQCLRLHKQILNDMHVFWGRLLNETVDTVQLAQIANRITSTRTSALASFEKALQNANATILRRYARFLEQIMLDTVRSRFILDRLAEQAQARRDAALKGRKVDSGLMNLSETASRQTTQTSINKDRTDSGSTTISRLAFNTAMLFLILLLVIVGFMVFEGYRTDLHDFQVTTLHLAGQSRTLSTKAGYMVREIMRAQLAGNTTQSSYYRQVLGDLVRLFVNTHNSLTYGSNRATYGPLIDFYKNRATEIFEFNQDNVAQRSLSSLWNLGNQYAAALSSIVNFNGTLVPWKLLQYVDTNVHSNVALAFNRSLEFYEDELVLQTSNGTWIAVGLYLASVVAIFIVYFTMILNFRKIGTAKLAGLNLFTLIPRIHVEKLHEQSQERIDTFDEDEEDDDKEAALQRLASGGNNDALSKARHVDEVGGANPLAGPVAGSATQQAMEGNYTADDEYNAINKIGQQKKKAQKQRNAKRNDNMRSTIFLFVALVVAVLLSVACFVMVYHLKSNLDTYKEVRTRVEDRADVQQGRYETIQFLTSEARLFSQNGNPHHFVNYWDLFITGEWEASHRALIYKASTEDEMWRYIQEMNVADDVLNSNAASMRLAASAYQSPRQIAYILDKTYWNYTRLSVADYLKYQNYDFSLKSASIATDTETDMIRPLVQQKEVSRSILFDDRYEADIDRLRQAERATVPTVDTETLNNLKSQRDQFFIATIACYVICFVVVMLLWFSVSDTFPRVLSILILCGLLCGAIQLGIMQWFVEKHERQFNSRAELRRLSNTTLSILSDLDNSILGFSQKASLRFYFQRRATQDSRALDYSLEDLMTHPTFLDEDIDTLSDVLTKLRRILYVQNIAAKLTLWGYGLNETDPLFSSLRSFVYSADLEDDKLFSLYRYPKESVAYKYNNNVLDKQRSQADQREMARVTLSNLQFLYVQSDTLNSMKSVFQRVMARAADSITQAGNDVENEKGASLAISVFCATTTLILALYLIVNAFQSIGANAKGARQEDSFAILTKRCRYALVVVAVCFALVFALSISNMQETTSMAKNLNLASSREWLVARSMVFAQRLWDADPADRYEARTRLLQSREDILQCRQRLYFGSLTSDKFNIVGLDSKQDHGLFGDETDSSSRFKFDCPIAQVTASSSIDADQIRWETKLLDLSTIDPSFYEGMRIDFLNNIEPLLFNLKFSSTWLETFYRDMLTRHRTILFSVLSITIFILVIEYLFVFRPMIQLLLDEDEGTKLMLKMIPQNVRSDVPAIAEYLETGVLTQDEKLQEINAAVSELSSVSTIAIDQFGTVSKFSRAAEAEFGYTAEEVIGANIKMLMPDEIARQHDGYLSRYRLTRIKNVVDKYRRVHARRKDGAIFPAEITVREFKKSPTESWFLGFVRNIATEMEFERATALNQAITEMSSDPLIIIDKIGTISRINPAVSSVFHYTANELNGQNIKMLMPLYLSERHDSFLQAYQETREKHVIDSSRIAKAIRKDGDEFPCEITVKEILNEDGSTKNFIGIVRDITHDLLFKQSVMVNEAVVLISPTPVVSITHQGIITTFNPAAETQFGYVASDVLGKNIKILMTDEDAKNHDGFLARYLKTGTKRVLDQSRLVKAKRRSGEVFMVEASIKELKRGDQQASNFIGYLRDASEEFQGQMQLKVNAVLFSACPIPIVCMDDYGTVDRFNDAAERLFGYRREDVLRQNVKMLMNEDIASRHDGYLEAYRHTGVKTIIGSLRRIPARKKNGQEFVAEISVRELDDEDTVAKVFEELAGAPMPGRQSSRKYFIGYLRDVTAEFRMITANQINEAITSLCTVPMISITQTGEIIAWSLSCEETFGYTEEEALGKNVKMLMPPELASKHDGYLLAYRQTGVKTVINARARNFAKHKNGRIFPCELSIREIVKQGLEPLFMGFARDLTQDLEYQDNIQLVDAIINCCPIPIIAIDARGFIFKFNDSASKVFQWKREEIMGKNIKALQTPEIARQHDMYLKTYAKTGIKNVIDQNRKVQGLRKDGLVLQLQISVRELKKTSNAGTEFALTETIFVGYLRDMSQEYILQQSNELKEVIVAYSSIPLVQVSVDGLIVGFNQAAQDEFGYSEEEAVGLNVKVLTPDEIAQHHDGYLARYKETRVKKVIDTTNELKAKRRDGTIFPVEISVRELVTAQNTSYFGYIRNMEKINQIRDMKYLSDQVIQKFVQPVVLINYLGTIIGFNLTASHVFGYDSSEVMGKNIKMLMPSKFADVHDDILARYKITRVKSVIDTTRRVVGLKKDGEQFPLEIAVKEATDETGENVYIGYMRDLTVQVRLIVANAVSELVANMSPVPIVAISEEGKILKFNKAAEDEFQYSAEEVLGQNVKMLQPDEIAAVHDGYLQRYKETGVKRVIDT